MQSGDDAEEYLPQGRHVLPACPHEGTAWIRPVDPDTVSFTLEQGDEARLYVVNVQDGSCHQAYAFYRPPQTANVWKNCEALINQGSIFTLVRHAPDRYVVSDVGNGRTVELPVRPDGRIAIDTVPDFWADRDCIIYLNHSANLSDESLIVACDWEGNVKWQMGLSVAFPDLYIYLWELSICPQPDGSFIVFFDGEAYPANRESELTLGLFWVRRDGTLLEAYRLLWRPDIMPEEAYDHIDGGGGFLVGDRPVLVAHLSESSVVRGREGPPFVINAPEVAADKLALHGVALAGARVIIGHGERGLTVHDLRRRTGLEPTLPEQDDGPTGLEPSL